MKRVYVGTGRERCCLLAVRLCRIEIYRRSLVISPLCSPNLAGATCDQREGEVAAAAHGTRVARTAAAASPDPCCSRGSAGAPCRRPDKGRKRGKKERESRRSLGLTSPIWRRRGGGSHTLVVGEVATVLPATDGRGREIVRRGKT